jgi:hypothetical protein
MATKTDNSKLEEKLIIRREVIAKVNKPKIKVIELYAGKSVMWSILRDEFKGRVEIELLSIEKEHGKNPRALQGDNLKFIDGIDLNRFDIVDVDAYGIPSKQLLAIHRQQFKGWVIVTAIQSMFGALPKEVLLANGITKEMMKKVSAVFVSKGLAYIKNFMYSLGSRYIRGFFEERKYYFYTRFEV